MKKSSKKGLIEWAVIILVFGILYITGYHTEVIGRMQQMLLWTGILQPDISLAEEEQLPVSYDWNIRSLEGRIIPMSEFKNKVIFINFWATWCPPCVAEMPDIHKLYKKMHSDDIVFLMISVDESPDQIEKFIRSKEFTFPVYQVFRGIPPELQSGTIPATFVITPEGKLVVSRKGMAKYNTEKFRQFLLNLLPADDMVMN